MGFIVCFKMQMQNVSHPNNVIRTGQTVQCIVDDHCFRIEQSCGE